MNEILIAVGVIAVIAAAVYVAARAIAATRRAKLELIDHIKNCRPYMVKIIPGGQVEWRPPRNIRCPHKGRELDDA